MLIIARDHNKANISTSLPNHVWSPIPPNKSLNKCVGRAIFGLLIFFFLNTNSINFAYFDDNHLGKDRNQRQQLNCSESKKLRLQVFSFSIWCFQDSVCYQAHAFASATITLFESNIFNKTTERGEMTAMVVWDCELTPSRPNECSGHL